MRDPAACLKVAEARYCVDALSVDHLDGVSIALRIGGSICANQIPNLLCARMSRLAATATPGGKNSRTTTSYRDDGLTSACLKRLSGDLF